MNLKTKNLKKHLIEITFLKRNRLIAGGCFAVLSVVLCVLSGCDVSFMLLSACAILSLSAFRIRFLNPNFGAVVCVIWGALCAFATFALIQIMQVHGNPITMPWKEVLNNELLFVGIYLASFVILGRFNLSILVSSTLLMLLGTANFFVYTFRGGELTPMDFLSLQTAANVAGGYHLWLEKWIVIAWVSFFGMAFATTVGDLRGYPRKLWKRAAALVCLLGCGFFFLRGIRNIQGTHWNNDGTYLHGYLVNFAIGFRQAIIRPPETYSKETLEALEERYCDQTQNEDREPPYPDVIVVMNESFSDFRMYGASFQTSEEVTPFYNSMTENTVKGYALASVFGGSTANSEYEFLTGNTMAFLPDISIPYQQYIQGDTYSLVSVFHNLGYYCAATHPYIASGWSRPSVYRAFGFDEITFQEDYPQTDLLRGFVTDVAFTNYIIKKYDALKKRGNVFMHCVSVQNHGPYDYTGNDFQNTVSLVGNQAEYPQAEQYLSLARLTDASIEILIRHFEEEERPVLIVYFGDHQPRIEQQYYEELHGGAFSSLDDKMLQYMVPFFVWANFDIEEKTVVCTSLNYLSNYLFEVSNIPYSAYNRFLTDCQTSIPAMNAYGYYSVTEGRYLSFGAAEDAEKEILAEYEVLQYNAAFDHKSLSRIFSLYMSQ